MFNLSLVLARSEFKLRNEGSYLGILWYLLNPILTFTLLLIIFSERLGENIEHYPLYLLLGIIIFNFFQQATTESTRVINDNRWIIKSINFSYESLILSIVIKAVLSHFFEILLFICFMIFYNVPIVGLLYYLIMLIVFCFFVAGVSFILATLTVFFNDLNNIWIFVVRLIWLGTPIFYGVKDNPSILSINLLNPLYYFITIARDLLIYLKIPDFLLIIGALGYTILFLSIGLILFKSLKYKFAELI